jgi:hypothetical protein
MPEHVSENSFSGSSQTWDKWESRNCYIKARTKFNMWNHRMITERKDAMEAEYSKISHLKGNEIPDGTQTCLVIDQGHKHFSDETIFLSPN